ncbi:MAG: glucosamine-6-phosphate deaminase [Trueperaceae bacterium]|nr:MAG: glucosamine-6-phosphate deaminase [Trueperaceae bacterium]
MSPVEPVRRFKVDELEVLVYESDALMGRAASSEARELIRRAIAGKGRANLILACANSQRSFLHALREEPGIDWSRVNVFHMDEYLGIDPDHPASFPQFLHQHFLNFVGAREFYPLPSRPEDAERACRDYQALLERHPADLVALGFGENGHLAFNDPPYADFDDSSWVKVVELAPESRTQQVGEGHFSSLAEVPTHAITLTIPALLAAERMLCLVPEARKAEAVRACLKEPISEDRPGSILRRAGHATLYLDRDSAALLEQAG